MLKIGHRGAAGYAPENTLKSFAKGLELKVDMVELDVQLCKTGELIVLHDETVDRTTNGKGRIAGLTFDEARHLDAGEGEKLPTLEEVFDLVNRRAKINVELKVPGTARPVHELIERYVAERGWEYTDFEVSSFDHYELLKFHNLTPQVPTGALIAGIPIGLAEFAVKAQASCASMCNEFISAEFIADAHARGLKVYVWTVNEPDEIAKLTDMGVDGLFSNYPDRIK